MEIARRRQAEGVADRLRKAAGWRDMDSAPKDGTRILVLTHHGDIEISEWYRTTYFRYEEVEGSLFGRIEELPYEGWNSNPPTRWQPLPDAQEGNVRDEAS